MYDESADTCELLCIDLPHAESIRASLQESDTVQAAAHVARALSDPTRLMIATALNLGDELCVCDIAWVVGMAQNLVSHHLRQLRNADMVTSRRNGKLVMYQLTTLGKQLTTALFTSIPTQGVDRG
ncbi:MAG: metalloregulator ArsR/SmtB family transcription factor [Mycobacterium sp.]